MFTGIVEETGIVERLERRSEGAKLTLRGHEILSDLERGGSIAINGACLTAVEISPQGFSSDLSPETLKRTNLGMLGAGDVVNLERPLLLAGRLGGHFVQGHVDGMGEFVSLESLQDGGWWLTVRAPDDLLRYLVFKGSIAIDGISLTVASLEGDSLAAAIIPHTYETTNLARLRSGAKVNIECDMIAKHVERLLASERRPGKSSLRIDNLKEQGY